MIARLRGEVVERAGARIILDVGGVGYDVLCSAHTLAALPPGGERVTLLVFTHAQENRIALYGFLEPAERALFDLLITVKNVGPSTAIGILSGGSTPRDIAAMIAREDVAGLTKVKGVGKKTAELIVVELHEKCELLLMSWNASGDLRDVAIPAGATAVRRARHPMLDEVAAALAQLGWRPAEADKAVADLVVDPGVTLEVLLRQALRAMPR